MNTNLVVDYIYKRRNGSFQKVGVLVGVLYNDRIRIGYSLCDKQDTFDSEYGFALALTRAFSDIPDKCPASIYGEVLDFAVKLKDYYGDYPFWSNKVTYINPITIS